MFFSLVGQYFLSTPSFVATRGLLLLLMIFGSVYDILHYVLRFLAQHCLADDSPPAKIVHRITHRRSRKHGRFRIVPQYPMLRRTHILTFLQYMLLSGDDHFIDHRVATAFRHIPWASLDQIRQPSIEYFDVSLTIPRSFKFTTIAWGSPPQEPFRLPTISTDGLFAEDDDPSDIMRLMNFDFASKDLDFGTTTNILTDADMPLYFSLLDNASCYSVSTVKPPLIVDTGASVCITPLKSDFETYRPSTMQIKDLSSSNKVAGEGLISWHVVTTDGKQTTLKLPGFHIPTAEVRLLSPQLLLHQAGGYSHQTSSKVHIHLDSGEDMDANYCPRTRLPMLRLLHNEPTPSPLASVSNYTRSEALAFPTLLSDTNMNLTAAQKEVLLWHHKLSHASISWIQLLMRDRKWLRDRVNNDDSFHSGPFLPCRAKGPTCDIDGLKCIACLCAKAQRRSTLTHTCHDPDDLLRFRQQLNGEATAALKRDHLAPGDCISADHYLSPVNGRLYTSFGRELRGYSCGTIFVDHASGKLFNFPQLSTTSADTIRSKRALERLAYDEGIPIKRIHSDNGVFASAAFREDCKTRSQALTFSGVGAHHQNGIAERNIKTVSQWARASMLHAAFHWHEHANIKLWPQAIDYAVWVFNRLPSIDHGLSPNELWSRSRATGHELRRAHPFGCPVFVLDPTLQDGHKIPKWDTRARRGMFVGFSPSHSSLVPLVLNISTGKITPQFHVVFDDKFHTVMSLPKGTTLRDEWLNILAFGNDCFLDAGINADDAAAIQGDNLALGGMPDHDAPCTQASE